MEEKRRENEINMRAGFPYIPHIPLFPSIHHHHWQPYRGASNHSRIALTGSLPLDILFPPTSRSCAFIRCCLIAWLRNKKAWSRMGGVLPLVPHTLDSSPRWPSLPSILISFRPACVCLSPSQLEIGKEPTAR